MSLSNEQDWLSSGLAIVSTAVLLSFLFMGLSFMAEMFADYTMYSDDCHLMKQAFEQEYAIIDESRGIMPVDKFIETCVEHMRENPDITGREMIELYKNMEGLKTFADLLDKSLSP